MPTSFVVIPARLASSRLPRKLLLHETGKPLIQHTYEAALRADKPLGVCVATDHQRIAATMRRFGACCRLTDRDHSSGTDRVAQVAQDLQDIDIIVNLQGDEPEISGAAIDAAISLLENDTSAAMTTLAAPIRDRTTLFDANCVKVVFDDSGRALFFSRAALPSPRNWTDSLLHANPPNFFQHVGLYAYRREFLLEFVNLPQPAAEKIEGLEQLRALLAGFPIFVAQIESHPGGIDSPEDYDRFVARMQQKEQSDVEPLRRNADDVST